jgi:hypothetical protein
VWKGVVGFAEGSAIAVTMPFGGGIVLLIAFEEAMVRICMLAGRMGWDMLYGVLGLSCEIANPLGSPTGAASNCNGEISGEGGNGTI